MSWFTLKTAAPGCLTADRNHVILKISKDTLRELGDAKSLALLGVVEGSNDGDWGGADYPERELSHNDVRALVPELWRVAPRRDTV
jgi:hypothetical protein